MDYEKKYNEALERARQIKDGKDEWRYSDLAEITPALTEIFPELKESEDERIRKEAISIVQSYMNICDEEGDPCLSGYEVLAYLEKQKEHQSCPDAPKEKSVGGNFYSSHKDKNLDEIAQEYVDRVKEYNPEPTWDLVQTAVCYGYYCCEQEEQSPADLPAGFYVTLDGKKYYAKEMRCNGMNVKVVEPKQEWSEEETKDLAHILKVLDDCYIYGRHDLSKTDYDNLTSTLKSLRPSWKPSEEQMEALYDSIEWEEERAEDVDFILKSLYNNLKKLM